MKYKIIVDKQSRTNPSVDKKEYIIDIEELRSKGDTYDSLVITKDEDYVMRRLELTDFYVLKELETPIKEVIPSLNIELFEGDNYIYLVDMVGNKFYAEYLIKNDFNDIYTTKSEMHSAIEFTAQNINLGVNQKLQNYSTTEEMNASIDVKANEINQVVSKKVGKDEIISRINQSAEGIAIKADKIDIAGKAVNFQTQINETIGPFTNENRDKLIKILMKEITPTVEDYEKLDVNKDGKLDSFDLLIITRAINNGGYYNLKGTFYINPYSGVRTLSLYNDMSKNYTAVLSLFESFFSQINTSSINLAATEATTSIYPSQYSSYLTENDTVGYIIGFMENGDNSEYFPYMNLTNGEHKINIFNGATDDTTYIEVLDNTVGASKITKIKASGITTPTLTQTSLATEKKNFEKLTLEEAKKILEKTDIYKYNLKSQNDSKKKHIGFVIGKKFNYAEEITSEKNDGANIYSMTSVLYTIVKEQQKTIDKLLKRVETLEAKK